MQAEGAKAQLQEQQEKAAALAESEAALKARLQQVPLLLRSPRAQSSSMRADVVAVSSGGLYEESPGIALWLLQAEGAMKEEQEQAAALAESEAALKAQLQEVRPLLWTLVPASSAVS